MEPKKIKELRLSLHMKRPEFGRFVAYVAKTDPVSHQAVYWWETGRNKPRGVYLRALEAIPRLVKEDPDILLVEIGQGQTGTK
ncbi:MAG: hypothetical protein KDD43_00260 [Bdellovibrionales bacterium]|nr:hypothetical protein [Bdellovibrionales bacterium]